MVIILVLLVSVIAIWPPLHHLLSRRVLLQYGNGLTQALLTTPRDEAHRVALSGTIYQEWKPSPGSIEAKKSAEMIIVHKYLGEGTSISESSY